MSNLQRERDEYLRQVQAGSFWKADQRDEPLWQVREKMDATDPQPATSEMLCGFVLGAICSLALIAAWNWKF